MLDRVKLLTQLQAVKDTLFADNSHEVAYAKKVWQEIAKDPLFAHKLESINFQQPLPTWHDFLSQHYNIAAIQAYTMCSVDGSQIYPDRHQGTSVFLINTGTVAITYGPQSWAKLSSQPYVLTADDQAITIGVTPELINCRRYAYELRAGLEAISAHHVHEVTLLAFDGSLIFWHLVAHEKTVQQHFAQEYIAVFEQLYQQKTLTAGYISQPGSKELVNLIRVAGQHQLTPSALPGMLVDHITDSTVAGFFLHEGQRSSIFKNNAAICQVYPEHLQPHFFYMHVGIEIVRVEIPAWIAQDILLVEQVAQILFDQAGKGQGYPIAIAEAHEQAVVKSQDREFFYYLVGRMGYAHGKQLSMSPKNIKKRYVHM